MLSNKFKKCSAQDPMYGKYGFEIYNIGNVKFKSFNSFILFFQNDKLQSEGEHICYFEKIGIVKKLKNIF